MEDSNYWDTVTRLSIPIRGHGKNHLKKARGEIWPKHRERRNNTKTTKMRTKSPQYIKINSQIKKPHLKMIPIKDKYNHLFTHIQMDSSRFI